MGIVDEDVQRVREATDLVELAREHIALKRVGRRFVGLCPFHSEKSGSFNVNPELGVYMCFGCQARGDAITFVRELEHLDFVGAIERLAQRAGITLRYTDANVSKDRQRKQRLHEAVAAAIDFYHRRLLEAPDGGAARKYLRGRGFDGDAARRFKVGFSPDNWDVLAHALQQQKFARDDLVDAGLAYVNRTNKLTDAFRGRLMFPIWDGRGEAVGFGARILDGDDGPKYKNTSETPIYRKSQLLYGLQWAKADIVARNEVVICEGYTDVMAFHLAGVTTAVATCGTALADDHFVMLKNLTRKITLAYDADAAGQAAAERCYAWEQKFEVQFQVADLPVGRDPGDLWPDGADRLAKSVEVATPFLEFRIDRLLSAADLASFEGRAHAGELAAKLVSEHPNDLVRDQYAVRIADRLQIEADRLREMVAQFRRGARPTVGSVQARRVEEQRRAQPSSNRPVDRRELDALRFAVHEPERVGHLLVEQLFADPLAREAYHTLMSAETFDGALDGAPERVAALLSRLAVEDPAVGAESLETLAPRVIVNLVEASSQRLLASMLRAGDERSSEVKQLLDALVSARDTGDYVAAELVAQQLVAWLEAGSEVGTEVEAEVEE
jgi:DNA primase